MFFSVQVFKGVLYYYTRSTWLCNICKFPIEEFNFHLCDNNANYKFIFSIIISLHRCIVIRISVLLMLWVTPKITEFHKIFWGILTPLILCSISFSLFWVVIQVPNILIAKSRILSVILAITLCHINLILCSYIFTSIVETDM